MLTYLLSQDNRRELYMVIGLVFTILTFSHTIFGWPVGPVHIPTQPDSTTQSGDSGRIGQIPWLQLLGGIPLLTVGILYYLGRRARQHSHPGQALTGDNKELQAEIARLNQHRIDLLGTISVLKDQHAQELKDTVSRAKYDKVTVELAQLRTKLVKEPKGTEIARNVVES